MVHFVVQWWYWLLATLLMDKFLSDDKPKTTQELLFKTTFMALFMTLFFQWKYVKLLFKKNGTK